MTLTSMTTVANQYADENYSTTLTVNYANEAISKINIEIGASLPFITNVSLDYSALSETWLRALIVPYICWSIKMNDGSLTEADRYLLRFNEALARLALNKNTAISSAYRGENFDEVYQIDMSGVSVYGVNKYPVYDNYETYYVGDSVYVSQHIYICIRECTGVTPPNATYWRLVS